MSRIIIGIVDYELGNHASLLHSLKKLNYRVLVSDEPSVLDQTDLLILPGVGAFPIAMKALKEKKLVSYLQQQAQINRPIIGICLGMQLLTEASHEGIYTKGLGLIPGETIELVEPLSHIGWNNIDRVNSDSILEGIEGNEFYFNHSYAYEGSSSYIKFTSNHKKKIAAIVRHGSVVGLQFHPEKSQAAGRELFKKLIIGMIDA
jgi:imidazole glycerol-phosphate synthase subunit HisH